MNTRGDFCSQENRPVKSKMVKGKEGFCAIEPAQGYTNRNQQQRGKRKREQAKPDLKRHSHAKEKGSLKKLRRLAKILQPSSLIRLGQSGN